MDKATVALSATEDNAAAIRELGRELKRRTSNRFIYGKRTSDGTSFGKIESDGTVCVLVFLPGTSQREIRYGSQVMWAFPLPALILLPKGNEELLIYHASGTLASAVVFGGNTQKSDVII